MIVFRLCTNVRLRIQTHVQAPITRSQSDMQRVLRHDGRDTRAQIVRMGCQIMPAAGWPNNVADRIASLLADALVKDLREHPIGELPASQLPS